MPPHHLVVRGVAMIPHQFYYPARGLGTPVAVHHAPFGLAQPRRDNSDEAIQTHHTTPQALHRAHTVCGPDQEAALYPMCASDQGDRSAATCTAQSHARNAPPPLYRGYLEALLSPYRL